MEPDFARQIADLKRDIDDLKNKRIFQQDIMPGVIKNRSLGDIILSSNASSASASFNTGDELIATFTLSQPDNSKLLGAADISLYLGSISAANQIPGGSGVTESQFQVIAGWNDWGSTDNNNIKNKVYIRNVSAGLVTIIFVSAWRYLTNTPNVTSS